ncbi:MAG: carbamoyltransferase HypF, partial [Deltaproteobacteria bacterium]
MDKKYIIRGIVQGVGFRPFVYRLATSIGLSGRVANTTEGVVVEVDGELKQLEEFRRRLLTETPPLARIDGIEESDLSALVAEGFTVAPSDGSGRKRLLITPDSDVCPNCLAELRDPHNRRYHYPFINCTDCGPRYTIIDDLPYDRQYTAMRTFPMCEECRREYEDPANRRYHAEATCCPVCGPRLWAADVEGREIAADPILQARSWLADGKIVAIKGIGGFHLAVDAANEEAVRLLRERKRRPDKPLAVMGRDLEAVTHFAEMGEETQKQLQQRTRPIVLASKKIPFPLAANVAPDNRFVGVMLPYTPIHHLLLENSAKTVLVMTSANLSGEPIVTDNREALAKLATIADGFLFHDRPILTPTDDSVLRVDAEPIIYLRRARSLAPLPLDLSFDLGRTLAVGADVKSTICLSRGHEAFVSQHLGDLDLLATQQNFERTCHHFMRLLQVEPNLVVRDLHPGYYSSVFADSLSLPAVQIQHHHAHAVSCMAEYGISSEVLALTMDGTGYGPDQTVWGGEVLIAGLSGYRRLAHLRQVRLPGGEAAVRQPWRMALSYLYGLFGTDEAAISRIRPVGSEESLVLQMLTAGLNSPLTSSCGRLFDAVAALLGLRER